MSFAFDPVNGLKDEGIFPSKPASGAAARKQVQDMLDQIRDHLNNISSCRVYHNTSQSIANNSTAHLSFNAEVFDTDAVHDTSVNNSRLTCKATGKYLIIGNVAFDVNSTGIRTIYIEVNRNGSALAEQSINALSGYQTNIVVSTICDLVVSDYVELAAYQNSGSPLNVNSAGTHFEMIRVG